MIGCLYGSQLQRAGFDVTFLFHGNAASVRRTGLRVDMASGNIVLPDVKAVDDPSELPSSDVVLVSLRTSDNHLLDYLLPPAMKPAATIVLLQNGLGNEEDVQAIIDQLPDDSRQAKVCRAMPFVLAEQIGLGHIKHDQFGLVTLSAPEGGTPHWVQKVASYFEEAGIEVATSDDLRQTIWEKLALNVPANGLPVLFHKTIGEIASDPSMAGPWHTLMKEVQLVAAIDGYRLDDGFIEDMFEKSKGMPFFPSMMRHYDARKSMELNSIYGRMLEIAHAHGVEVPATELLCGILSSLDTKNIDHIAGSSDFSVV